MASTEGKRNSGTFALYGGWMPVRMPVSHTGERDFHSALFLMLTSHQVRIWEMGPALWHSQENRFFLWCQHPIWCCLVSWLLLFQSSSLLVACENRQGWQVLGALHPCGSPGEGSSEPGSDSAQLWPLWPSGERSSRWEDLAVSSSPVTLSNK